LAVTFLLVWYKQERREMNDVPVFLLGRGVSYEAFNCEGLTVFAHHDLENDA
jgi:hypothetical protein